MDMIFIDYFCYFMGLLLLVSGKSKWINAKEYVDIVNQYNFFGLKSSVYQIKLLAALEILTCILLLLSTTQRIGAMLAIAIFTLYFIAIAKNLISGNKHVRCGCGGSNSLSEISGFHLLRLAILIGVMIVVLITFKNITSYDLLVLEHVFVLTISLATLFIYFAIDYLVTNHKSLKKLREFYA